MLLLLPCTAAAVHTACCCGLGQTPEVEWHDACSTFSSHPSDYADRLAEVDQLAIQASLQQQQGPWVPDPPLKFAGELRLY